LIRPIMPRFSRSVFVAASIGKVFGFHQREDALQLLSPPFPPLHVIRKTGGIEPGAIVKLRIGPIPWVALHTAFQQNVCFEDMQVEGPFASWKHRHAFQAVEAGTILTDTVDYTLPGGPLTGAIAAPFIHLALVRMFAHRHAVTKHYCESAG